MGLVLAEKLLFVENWTRGIRNSLFCLDVSGFQCSFVVSVRAFQTSSQRQAANTRSPSGEDAREAVRLQFIPKSVGAETKQSRHKSRVLVMRLLRATGNVGLGLLVVRGAMLSVVGSIECATEMVCAFWWQQDLKIWANMDGEEERHMDD